MYQEIHINNIAKRAHAPEVAELLRRFNACADGAAGAPHDVFGPSILSEFGDDLMLMRPTGDGDYEYLFYGREIIRYVGCDRTGRRVSQMSPQVAKFSIATYDQVLSDGRPVYTVHRSLKTIRVCLWERLVLPTTMVDGSRLLIVFSRPLQFREELLTTVLDTSPSGIVALRAVRTEDGDIERAIIITANRRASLLTGHGGEPILDRDVRETLPFLHDETCWRRCLYAIELRRADMFEICLDRDGKELWLQVSVAPLGDGLVMTMTDISELMLANLTLQSRAATLALEIGLERATRRALSYEIGQREEREQELRRLAETDPLTALLNRRSFVDKATSAIADGDRAGCDTCVVMIDLDHFKSVNDAHGHAAGDAVIRAFADLLLGMVRSDQDLVGRFGGEEFALLLPRSGIEQALRVAQRIIEAMATRRLPVTETLSLQVTASLGIAMRLPDESLGDFMDRADRALYVAKNEGRNCVRIATQPIAAAA